MRKLATSVLVLAAVAAFAIPAFATTLLSESFPYPDNTGLLANGWAATGGNTGVDINVLNGKAVGNTANAPDDNKGFGAQPTTQPTYACFEAMITQPASGSPKLVYFAHFSDGGSTIFVTRVYAQPFGSNTSSTFTFALSHSSTGTNPATQVGPVPWPQSLNYGQFYQIVIKYDPVNVTSTMWVNPTDETSPSISQVFPFATSAVAVSAFCLRQSATASSFPPAWPNTYSGGSNFVYTVDNLGVGTTFVDACSQYTPARESTWGRVKKIYR
jgi:hypothetical protein